MFMMYEYVQYFLIKIIEQFVNAMEMVTWLSESGTRS